MSGPLVALGRCDSGVEWSSGRVVESSGSVSQERRRDGMATVMLPIVSCGCCLMCLTGGSRAQLCVPVEFSSHAKKPRGDPGSDRIRFAGGEESPVARSIEWRQTRASSSCRVALTGGVYRSEQRPHTGCHSGRSFTVVGQSPQRPLASRVRDATGRRRCFPFAASASVRCACGRSRCPRRTSPPPPLGPVAARRRPGHPDRAVHQTSHQPTDGDQQGQARNGASSGSPIPSAAPPAALTADEMTDGAHGATTARQSQWSMTIRLAVCGSWWAERTGREWGRSESARVRDHVRWATASSA